MRGEECKECVSRGHRPGRVLVCVRERGCKRRGRGVLRGERGMSMR